MITMIIPSESYKLLKRFDKLEIFDLKVSDMRNIHILADAEYIKIHFRPTIEDLSKNSCWTNYLTITPKGRIYISDLRSQRLRFTIPLVISSCLSIIALIISIIALLKP